MSRSLVPNLLAWARNKRRPVSVFQLTATVQVPHVVWFGILDLGHITVFPNGRVETRSAYVNPDCRISSETAERTGICEADVAERPSWAAWAPIFHLMAQDHVMLSFDFHALGSELVRAQNERYGIVGTTFRHALDARALPEVAGTLPQAVARFGTQVEVTRRALGAAWLTASLVEAVAAQHGLEVLDACMGLRPSSASHAAPRPAAGHTDAMM